MGIAEESTDKIMSVSFRAASVTADLLIQALKSLLEAKEKQQQEQRQAGTSHFTNQNGMKVKVKTGKMKLSELSEKGVTDSIDISNKKEFATIKKLCKKYNIDYSVMATKGPDGKSNYTIFFKTNDTNIMKKMLDEAIRQEELREAKREQKQERREEKKAQKEERNQNRKAEKEEQAQETSEDNADPDKANEKNRETMGDEEREKEEPIKTPEVEKEMPVRSNEPAAKTTDDVKVEKEKEEVSKEGRDAGEVPRDIKADDVRNMSTERLWAETERESQAAARESKLRAIELNQGTPRFSLESLKADLMKKLENEKNNPSIPKLQKDKQHDSLEM